MSRLAYLLTILMLGLALHGCGGSPGATPGASSTGASTAETGTLVVTYDAEELSSQVTEVEFTGLGADGQIVYGPFTRLRASTFTLTVVPVTIQTLRTAFYQVTSSRDRTLLGTRTTRVTVSGGQTTRLVHDCDPLAPVYFAHNGSAWTFMVNGQPFTMKGVGFDYTTTGDMSGSSWFSYVSPDIKASGANTIRMYGLPWNFGTPQQQAALVSAMLAQAKLDNLMIIAGWEWTPVGGNTQQMQQQIVQTVQLVEQDPNYGNLLTFVIGRENASSDYADINAAVKAVQATMTAPTLKRPVTHCTATVSAGYVATIQSQLPDIDWLAIDNFYGSFDATHSGGGFLNQQASNLATWTLPWGILEFYSYDLPAPGSMPSQTLNGTPYFLELNSTSNAANYTNSWTSYISGQCLGGCVLNWGPPHNSKIPAYWKEVYTYEGAFQAFVNPPWTGGATFDRLQCAYAVAALYGGSFGTNQPPQIQVTDGDPQGIACTFKATLTTNPTPVSNNQSLTASITATDPDGDTLTCDWYLIGGSSAGYTGDIKGPNKNCQDYVSTTSLHLGTGTTAGNTNTITFNAPTPTQSGNNYQLRVIIHDGHGNAATAAIGFPMQ